MTDSALLRPPKESLRDKLISKLGRDLASVVMGYIECPNYHPSQPPLDPPMLEKLARRDRELDCPGDIGPHESFKPTTPGNPAEALFILEHILAAEIRNLVVCLKRALASSTETEMYRREVSPNASESSKAENDS